MKRFRSTWILFVVVAALAGYTIYEFKKGSDLPKGEVQLFDFADDQPEQLVITRGSEVIELRKSGDAWKLIRPVEDDAENAAVDSFLYSLVGTKGRVFLDPDSSPPNAKDYGLEPAEVRFDVSAGKKKGFLELSSMNAYDGSFYVRTGAGIFLGDRGLAQLKDRNANAFRSHRMWRFGDPSGELNSARAAQFERIDVTMNLGTLKQKFALVKNSAKDSAKNSAKEEATWSMEPAPSYPIDSERVVKFWNRIQELMAREFVKEEMSEKDKAEYLLDKPSYVLSLPYSQNDQKGEWILTIGQNKGESVYLYTNQRPTLYRAVDVAMSSVRLPREAFRDGHPPFQFSVEEARELEIKTTKNSPQGPPPGHYKFTKSGDGWQATNSPEEVSSEALVTTIQNLKALEAEEFLTSAPKAVKMDSFVRILGADKQIVLEISWGGEHKSSRPDLKNLNLTYVKSNLEKGWLAVSTEKLAQLISKELAQPKYSAQASKDLPSNPESK